MHASELLQLRVLLNVTLYAFMHILKQTKNYVWNYFKILCIIDSHIRDEKTTL